MFRTWFCLFFAMRIVKYKSDLIDQKDCFERLRSRGDHRVLWFGGFLVVI
jgi:hypothetical protein